VISQQKTTPKERLDHARAKKEHEKEERRGERWEEENKFGVHFDAAAIEPVLECVLDHGLSLVYGVRCRNDRTAQVVNSGIGLGTSAARVSARERKLKTLLSRKP
jgi:hypothetical protein